MRVKKSLPRSSLWWLRRGCMTDTFPLIDMRHVNHQYSNREVLRYSACVAHEGCVTDEPHVITSFHFTSRL